MEPLTQHLCFQAAQWEKSALRALDAGSPLPRAESRRMQGEMQQL